MAEAELPLLLRFAVRRRADATWQLTRIYAAHPDGKTGVERREIFTELYLLQVRLLQLAQESAWTVGSEINNDS